MADSAASQKQELLAELTALLEECEREAADVESARAEHGKDGAAGDKAKKDAHWKKFQGASAPVAPAAAPAGPRKAAWQVRLPSDKK